MGCEIYIFRKTNSMTCPFGKKPNLHRIKTCRHSGCPTVIADGLGTPPCK